MSEREIKNIAYIDGANLYHGMKSLGWKLDYQRFRVWLKDKYKVKVAYIFIGLIPKNKDLYVYLQESGFTLVFKEVIYDGDGNAKGNCDADLVLFATRNNFEQPNSGAVIVSSDGDFSSLVKFLNDKNKLIAVLSPHEEKLCSVLLKRTGVNISYIKDQKTILEKEKAPSVDETTQGSFS